jgi:hypothetical protein
LQNTNKPHKESLCLGRTLRKQDGDSQKEKADAKLPNHWPSKLGSEVTCQNEEHHKNVEGAENTDS